MLTRPLSTLLLQYTMSFGCRSSKTYVVGTTWIRPLLQALRHLRSTQVKADKEIGGFNALKQIAPKLYTAINGYQLTDKGRDRYAEELRKAITLDGSVPAVCAPSLDQPPSVKRRRGGAAREADFERPLGGTHWYYDKFERDGRTIHCRPNGQ
jgi:hypothetical protein